MEELSYSLTIANFLPILFRIMPERPFVQPDEAAAGMLLGGPDHEKRMSPHVVPELEAVLADPNHFEALRDRTLRMSPETTTLIQQGLFSPDFRIEDVPYYDQNSDLVEDPKPYERWEAVKELRNSAIAILTGMSMDLLNARLHGQELQIPLESGDDYLQTDMHPATIVHRDGTYYVQAEEPLFSGFGSLGGAPEGFRPSDITNIVQPDSEYSEEFERIITSDVSNALRFSLVETLFMVSTLPKNHPVFILYQNLQKMLAVAYDSGIETRDPQVQKHFPEGMGDLYQFISGGIVTAIDVTDALGIAILERAKEEGLVFTREEFVEIFRNSLPILLMIANQDVFIGVGLMKLLLRPLTEEEEAKRQEQQEEKDPVPNNERKIQERFYTGNFEFERNKAGRIISIRIRPERFKDMTNLSRMIMAEGVQEEEKLHRGIPRRVTRCPMRQNRAFGKKDGISTIIDIVTDRLNELNRVYEEAAAQAA